MSTSRTENSARPYHHGHLREALVDAALTAARVDGPAAVILRAATRAAGVSPNAAYRHFADRDDLLRAVAGRCQDKMASLMEARLAHSNHQPGSAGAWQQLRVAGRAYVDFAIAEPGWFRTAFSIALDMQAAQPDHPRPLYQILANTLDNLVTAGAIPSASRPGAEYVAWSAVHGIATLITDGSLRDLAPHERDAAIQRVINAVAF